MARRVDEESLSTALRLSNAVQMPEDMNPVEDRFSPSLLHATLAAN